MVLNQKWEPLIVRLRRIWCYANNRPQTERQQRPGNARQQTRVHPPRVTLSPHETDQGAEWCILRGPFGHDRPKVAPVHTCPPLRSFLTDGWV